YLADIGVEFRGTAHVEGENILPVLIEILQVAQDEPAGAEHVIGGTHPTKVAGFRRGPRHGPLFIGPLAGGLVIGHDPAVAERTEVIDGPRVRHELATADLVQTWEFIRTPNRGPSKLGVEIADAPLALSTDGLGEPKASLVHEAIDTG